MNFLAHTMRFAVIAQILFVGATATACPFCSVESQTLSEEMQASDATVLAKLIEEAPPQSDEVGNLSTDPNSGTAVFEIVEVLRGQDRLGDTKQIRAVYFGEPDRERLFLITGLGNEIIDWTTPLPLTPAAVDYVRKLPTLPPSGPDRIAFFQDYFEHADPLLAQDAYDEFARTPYADVIALGPRMHHDRLVELISDLNVSPSRRRLYFTMLGVCGRESDLPLLESMIGSDFDVLEPQLKILVSNGLAMGGPIGLTTLTEFVQQDERRKKLGLDALVACYLTLRGGDGLDLIDERYLKNSKAEYTHVYSAIMALRFHGDEDTSRVPRDRLLQSMRLLLDNPDFADQVILDLSRWEDWSVLERLVDMFNTADDKGYVRQPIVTYLTVASEQPGDVGTRAAAALAELERIDPKTVAQARSLMAFGALGRARASGDGSNAARSANESVNSESNDSQAFAATTADSSADTSDIPDPAGFENRELPSDAQAEAGSKPVIAKTVTVVEPVEPRVNRLLVVGVPLVAAGLLMGIYWVILRVGAL